MTELKPCPFCEGEPDAQHFNISPHLPGRIICACGAEMRQGRYQEEDEIISAWNTRSDYTVQAANERKFDGIPMTEENMAEHGWVRERTCKLTQAMTLDGKTPDVGFGICSECGGRADLYRPYCPNFGAKVVEHGDKQ